MPLVPLVPLVGTAAVDGGFQLRFSVAVANGSCDCRFNRGFKSRCFDRRFNRRFNRRFKSRFKSRRSGGRELATVVARTPAKLDDFLNGLARRVAVLDAVGGPGRKAWTSDAKGE